MQNASLIPRTIIQHNYYEFCRKPDSKTTNHYSLDNLKVLQKQNDSMNNNVLIALEKMTQWLQCSHNSLTEYHTTVKTRYRCSLLCCVQVVFRLVIPRQPYSACEGSYSVKLGACTFSLLCFLSTCKCISRVTAASQPQLGVTMVWTNPRPKDSYFISV